MRYDEAVALVKKLAFAAGFDGVVLEFFEYVREEAEDWGDSYKSSLSNESAVVRGLAKKHGLDEVLSAVAYKMVLDGFREMFAVKEG